MNMYPADYAKRCSEQSTRWFDQYPSLINQHGSVTRESFWRKDGVEYHLARFEDDYVVFFVNNSRCNDDVRSLTPKQLEIRTQMEG